VTTPVGPLVPGEVVVGNAPVRIHDEPDLEVRVRNTGDRPIQVGSHFHFAEANDALEFDRVAAWGHRLAIAAGTALRFEPGLERTVPLIPLRGRRIVAGLRGRAAGPLDGAGGPA
jgi:urease subunit beta